MLPLLIRFVSLLGDDCSRKDLFALSFMVVCFCFSDVSYWKNMAEKLESFSALKPEASELTVCSLHVQLQSPPNASAREPPTERKGTLIPAGNCKLIWMASQKSPPLISKGHAIYFWKLFWLDDWIATTTDFKHFKVIFYLVRYKNSGLKDYYY